MKKTVAAVCAGLFFLAACNQTKDASTSGTAGNDMAATNERNVAHHNAILRAIETGNMAALDTLMSKDVVDHEGNMGKDIVGLDSVKVFLGSLHNYFDNLRNEVLYSATSPDGQYFFATVRMRGKAKANPWGMPVGQEMDDTSVDVVKIKDGKATDHWGFTSMKDMMEMMSPAPGSGQMPSVKVDTATH